MSSKEAWGASGKGDLFQADYPKEGEPHALTLVVDKAHPLYDERVHWPLDEGMIQNIMIYGIIEPLVVRLNGKRKDGQPNVEIVDGKQRYRHGYEANKRLLAEGKKPIRVPFFGRGGDAHTLFGVMVSSNVHRRGEEQLDLAAKVSRFLAMNGASKKEAAVTFGFKTAATVDTYLALHEKAHDAVKAKIREGMPVMVAKELLDLPQEEQPAALQKLVEAGALSGARGVEAAREVRRGRVPVSDKVRAMSVKAIGALMPRPPSRARSQPHQGR